MSTIRTGLLGMLLEPDVAFIFRYWSIDVLSSTFFTQSVYLPQILFAFSHFIPLSFGGFRRTVQGWPADFLSLASKLLVLITLLVCLTDMWTSAREIRDAATPYLILVRSFLRAGFFRLISLVTLLLRPLVRWPWRLLHTSALALYTQVQHFLPFNVSIPATLNLRAPISSAAATPQSSALRSVSAWNQISSSMRPVLHYPFSLIIRLMDTIVVISTKGLNRSAMPIVRITMSLFGQLMTFVQAVFMRGFEVFVLPIRCILLSLFDRFLTLLISMVTKVPKYVDIPTFQILSSLFDKVTVFVPAPIKGALNRTIITIFQNAISVLEPFTRRVSSVIYKYANPLVSKLVNSRPQILSSYLFPNVGNDISGIDVINGISNNTTIASDLLFDQTSTSMYTGTGTSSNTLLPTIILSQAMCMNTTAHHHLQPLQHINSIVSSSAAAAAVASLPIPQSQSLSTTLQNRLTLSAATISSAFATTNNRSRFRFRSPSRILDLGAFAHIFLLFHSTLGEILQDWKLRAHEKLGILIVAWWLGVVMDLTGLIEREEGRAIGGFLAGAGGVGVAGRRGRFDFAGGGGGYRY